MKDLTKADEDLIDARKPIKILTSKGNIIVFTHGDIFKTNCEFIVNPVNCVGVCGKGLAWEFARRYPKQTALYKETCTKGLMVPGEIVLVVPPVVFFFTKNHWFDNSKLEWITNGMRRLVESTDFYKVKDVAVPALGVGNGKLPWERVWREMYNQVMLSKYNTNWIFLYP